MISKDKSNKVTMFNKKKHNTTKDTRKQANNAIFFLD
jgi:hypothetical protein